MDDVLSLYNLTFLSHLMEFEKNNTDTAKQQSSGTCVWSIYISQLIGYSRACDPYHGFLDRRVAANKEATKPKVPSG